MIAEVESRKIWTGNIALDAELSLLGDEELVKLASYARYLRWVHEEEDDDWADAPLTAEEEEGLRRGRENARNGNYLTLAEFRESQRCGQ